MIDFSKKVIQQYIIIEEVHIVPVYALQALQAREKNSQTLWKESGLEILIKDLHARLVSKKACVLEESLSRRLKQVVMRMVNTLELQRQALLTPYKQLEANTHAFAVFVEESSRTLRENEQLLDGEIKRLLADFDNQVRMFCTTTTPLINLALEESYANCKKQSSKTVKIELESTLSKSIKQTLSSFRKQQ